MAENCPVCNKRVEITEVKSYSDHKERFFSCGHKIRLSQRTINEPAINISDSIALVISRFKQSEKIRIEEKLFDEKPSLDLSADNANLIINNSIVNINTPETTFSQNISPHNILDKIQTIIREVKTDSLLEVEQREKVLSFLEKTTEILSYEQATKTSSKWSRLKNWLSGKKWVFPVVTPYILKIIELFLDRWKRNKLYAYENLFPQILK
jgi:hypothetical protein